MEKMDYYKILNIKRDATQDDIKAAYRKLAKQYHPDKFATAPEEKKREAEEKFKEIQHAYDVLSDTQKKAAYDQYGSEDGPNMNSNFGGGFNPFGGGFSTIFEDMFFDEAVEVISRTTNWYEDIGSGYIRKVDRNMVLVFVDISHTFAFTLVYTPEPREVVPVLHVWPELSLLSIKVPFIPSPEA